jgi:hypothetical protein
MKNGAKIMVTELELRFRNKRLSATVKAANSRSIFIIAASLFIFGSADGQSFDWTWLVARCSNPLAGSFFVPNLELREKSIIKNTSQQGGSYALHHIFSPAVCTALPYHS